MGRVHAGRDWWERTPRAMKELVAFSVLWALIAVAFATHNFLTYLADGRPVALSTTLWWSVAEWLPWVVLTPVVLVVVRAYRPRRGTFVSATLTLAAAGIVVAVAQVLLEYGLDRAAVSLSGDPSLTVRVWLAHGMAGPPLDLAYLIPRKFGFSYITYWAVVITALAFEYYRLYVERDVRAARLESALLSAQLETLQAQLQPHFLFNALNAIASLIPEDPAAAEETVESLSELLRASLREGGRHEIRLARELELLELYLSIQATRFHRRLRIRRGYDPALDRALVPPMVLQPLVENAIRHGTARRGGGTVAITTRAAAHNLELIVEDDGPGIGDFDAAGSGIGISNTRLRLERLYGRAASLEVGNRPDGGAFARVRLPLRLQARAEGDNVRYDVALDPEPVASDRIAVTT